MISHLKIDADPRVITLLEGAMDRGSFSIPPLGSKTFEEFITQEVPSENVNGHGGMAASCRIEGAGKFISAAATLLGATECTNAVVYPGKSYMGWHTNADNPGRRTYYTYTTSPAVFRYQHNGECFNSEDNIGTWTVRSFIVDADEPFWHTVWAEGERYVFGFNSPT